MENYEIIDEIGKGSFSRVYKVKSKLNNEFYAMKEVYFKDLSSKEINNSINEIRILASINCPNIISYKEAFYIEKGNTLNIVMEFCNDSDLDCKLNLMKKKKDFLTKKKYGQS